MRSPGRLIIAALITSVCLAGIVAFFWWYDWRVSLPTPVPAGHVALKAGTRLELPAKVAQLATPGAPVLIHFYNPDCPCSRFNKEQLEKLELAWGKKVRFIVVAETMKALDEIASPLPDELAPLILDPDSELADALHVYSTPQAVLLDGERTLIYAGNYNTSRYCTDPKTEFVRLALEQLESNSRTPLAELPSWGCQLPAHVARNDSEGAP